MFSKCKLTSKNVRGFCLLYSPQCGMEFMVGLCQRIMPSSLTANQLQKKHFFFPFLWLYSSMWPGNFGKSKRRIRPYILSASWLHKVSTGFFFFFFPFGSTLPCGLDFYGKCLPKKFMFSKCKFLLYVLLVFSPFTLLFMWCKVHVRHMSRIEGLGLIEG